jgi:hypothetical protein
MSSHSDMPETLHCDGFRVDGRDLICELGGREVRRIARDDILGWCDTAQGSYSIVMRDCAGLDFPGYPEELEAILSEWFPDSFHCW